MSDANDKDDDFGRLKLPFIPPTPEITRVTSPRSTVRSKSQGDGEPTIRKKKFKLGSQNTPATTEDLALILIYVVIKPQANLDQDAVLQMIEPITAWLGLHFLKM